MHLNRKLGLIDIFGLVSPPFFSLFSGRVLEKILKES